MLTSVCRSGEIQGSHWQMDLATRYVQLSVNRQIGTDTAQSSGLPLSADTVQSSGPRACASLPAYSCFHGLFSEKTPPRVFYNAIYAFRPGFLSEGRTWFLRTTLLHSCLRWGSRRHAWAQLEQNTIFFEKPVYGTLKGPMNRIVRAIPTTSVPSSIWGI